MWRSVAFAVCLSSVLGGCPYLGSIANVNLPPRHPPVAFKSASLQSHLQEKKEEIDEYVAAAKALNWDAVRADLVNVIKSSQSFWPSDFGNYGPLFIRLAWHCAGSHRRFDGRGGCDGGLQRFDPERSWEDNTNLDKARRLLEPIKQKYGLGLSWGDLIIFAGNTAIEVMGGKLLGFCAGRIDEPDGTNSQLLGPTPEQQAFAPCPVDGACPPPLATTTLGLIYVDAEGPRGNPDPELSAQEIRAVFGRMGMNTSEAVALIGGGHTVGKAHGACPLGAGPSPKEDPFNPWPGRCGTGKGADAFTSGFEGPWTNTPTTFDNNYFKILTQFDKQWFRVRSPAGKVQWVANGTPPAPGPQGRTQRIMMLTSDIALIRDPAGLFQPSVKRYTDSAIAQANSFAAAWYKLTTRDMGPATRCLGKTVPPPQPWQFPLPPTPKTLADFSQVRSDIMRMLRVPQSNVLPPDVYNGQANYGPLFVWLAFRCAATFRQTDYHGGCNGARIRFEPEKSWPINAGLDRAIQLLQPIKTRHGVGLSWADLIVLAGNTALEEAGAPPLQFCAGRTDGPSGAGAENLSPGNFSDQVQFHDRVKLLGLTPQEFTALLGGHSLGQMHVSRTGYTGAWTTTPTRLCNDYYRTLLSETWERIPVPGTAEVQYKAMGKPLYALPVDLMLRIDPVYLAVAQQFAADNARFLRAFSSAWTKLMTADLYDGPKRNVCAKPYFFKSRQ